MAATVASLVLVCLVLGRALEGLRVPPLVGFLLVGVAVGPAAFGLLDPALLEISPDLRLVALIVILLRAGLGLRRETLRRVGARALALSLLPALLEGIAITLVGPRLFDLTTLEAALLGTVVAAVSPAVIVPMMLDFQARGRGTDKHIPSLVLAGASVDDVNVIVAHGLVLGLYLGTAASPAWQIASAPISIVSGAAVGLGMGALLLALFRRFETPGTRRVLVLGAVSVLLVAAERSWGALVPFAPLLAVMAIGFVVLERHEAVAHDVSARLVQIWILAEILLFVLAGSEVDPSLAAGVIGPGLALIGAGLVARSLGVLTCLLGSELATRERLFVALAYMPKATVQAAIGAAPLVAMRNAGMDTGPGELIAALAVLSILATAPLGAWLIALVGERVLGRADDPGVDDAKRDTPQ